MKLQTVSFALTFAFASLSCGADAWAQAGTGELTGLVTDATGAVVPGVQVDLVNSATGIGRQTLSSSAGVYRFVSLPIVGTYTLTVQQPGFKVAKVEGIVMTVGTTITHDIKLEVGAPADVVTVTSGAELVQSTESAVSTLVDRNVWQNMPLEVRNQNTFINLVAGAVPDAMAGSTRGAAVNGARGGAGNYLVEGTDNNDQGQAGRGQLSPVDPGGAATSISPDAIGEYRVITNSFAAEYGKAGGFVTDTVLKSGTNQWHGSLFEYNRVQALAANGFFSNANGLEDSLVRNQFGGSVGGPIVKEKAFFFYSMEWHRFRQANALSAVGTTQQYLDWVKTGGLQQWAESDPSGVCMQSLGAPCRGKFSKSATLGPIFSDLAATGPFPLATSRFSNTGAGFYTTDLRYPVPVYGDVFVSDPTHLNEYRISAKVDYQLTSKDVLSGLYLNQTANSGDPYSCGNSTIGPACISDGRGQNWGVTWNHIFSPTVTNTLKASYLRHRSDYPAPPGTEGIPAIATAYDPLGVGFGLYAGIPQYFTDTQYQVQNHVSIIRGKHSFRTGVEYRRTVNASSFFNDTSGTFFPYGVEDLVTDLAFTDEADLAILGELQNGSVYSASAAVDPTTGQLPDSYRGFRANEFAAYFQDDWRVSQRLTINWGLRWEYFGPPHNFRPDIDSNFYFGIPLTPIATTSNNPFFPSTNPFYASMATGTFQVRNNEIWNKDTNNFGPRLGFAYDVFGNQRVILRGGAGVMYDRIYNNVFENIRFNPPYYSDNQIGTVINGVPVGALSTPGLYTVPFTSTPAFASGGLAPKPNPRHMDQNMVSSYYEQFHLGVQWEFVKGYALEVEYVSTLGHKLIGYYDINTFNGRMARGYNTTRINTNIGADNYRNNGFSSNYHGGQATIRKNFTGGLGLNASYTWSRALDNLSDLFNPRAGITDTMNLRTDYGPSDFNMTNRFVGTVSYVLPFARQDRWLGGWQLNAIISLQSGVPFSPINSSSGYDVNKNGLPNDRIVYTGSGKSMDSLTEGTSPADSYFDKTQWARYICPSSVNGGLWCLSPQGRGTMTGPAYQNVDFNIIKRFRIKEGSSVSLQGAFFNLFNHPNFGLPSSNSSSSSFGRSRSAYDARITQLAVRIDF